MIKQVSPKKFKAVVNISLNQREEKIQLQGGDVNCYCQTVYITTIFSKNPHAKKLFIL